MSRPAKIALGIASVIPLVTTVLYWLGAFTSQFPYPQAGTFDSYGEEPLLVLATVFMIELEIIFIVHLVRNERYEGRKKWLCAVALVLAAPISLPVYWYGHIWLKSPVQPPRRTPRDDSPRHGGAQTRQPNETSAHNGGNET